MIFAIPDICSCSLLVFVAYLKFSLTYLVLSKHDFLLFVLPLLFNFSLMFLFFPGPVFLLINFYTMSHQCNIWSYFQCVTCFTGPCLCTKDFFFLQYYSEWPYLLQKQYKEGFHSYKTFCSTIKSFWFLNKMNFGSLASIWTSTSSLAKCSPLFFSVLWSTMSGLPNRLPSLLKFFWLQYLKSKPGNLIYMGTIY